MSRISDIDEMVLCCFENFFRWFGRTSIQSTIDLYGINTDDFPVVLLRQEQAQLAFTSGGRSNNDYEFV